MERRVEFLFIYPVKSIAGVPSREASIEATGLAADRRWVVVTPAGLGMTQRQHPRLVLVRAALTPSGLWCLTAPGMPPLTLEPDPSERGPIQVWNDSVAAVAAARPADQWISRFLGVASRFAHLEDPTARPFGFQGNPDAGNVSFADQMPLHVVFSEDVVKLERHLGRPVSISRFRPNVVLSGEPMALDTRWGLTTSGGVELELVCPCERCSVLSVDPSTGAAGGSEVLQGLVETGSISGSGATRFGWLARPLRIGGVLRVGDVVTLTPC